MDAISRYRRRTEGKLGPKSPFIEKALNKIIVQKFVGGETSGNELEAVLIFKDKEGPDYGVLYTYADDGLNVGDTIVKKGERKENDVYFLLIEEVKRVDTSVTIRVFNVLETNVNIEGAETLRPAYMLSNLRNKIREPGRGGLEIESGAALLIAPQSYKLRLDDILNVTNLISGESAAVSWQVYGIDNVTSPIVAYHHLTQVLKAPIKVEMKTYTAADQQVNQGEVITFATEDGHIQTTPTARVMSRKASEVKVQIPIMTGLLAVEVKEDNELKTILLEVRE